MRTGAAEENFDDEEGSTFHGEEFNIWNEPWSDGIRNQIGEPFLIVQRVVDANDMMPVVHPENETTAGGVRKSDQRLENRHRRGEIALELKLLSFRRGKNVGDVHGKDGV